MALGAVGVGILGAVALIGVAYSMVKVPDPNKAVLDQNSVLYYRDGKTVLAKLGETNRQIVPLNKVPPYVQEAVLASEDKSFRSEHGFSPTGVARAVVNDLSGGNTQGGSGITQQLVKNMYLTQSQTFTRKFKELFISVKIEQKHSKEWILENYLNTIYFGRGANGIEAAAQAYFGKHVWQLTPGEGSLLAINIRAPGYYDPQNKDHIQKTLGLYQANLDTMVKMKAIQPAVGEQYKQKLPQTRKLNDTPEFAGQNGFLISRAKNALINMGYTEQELDTGGLQITTTWDKNLQKQAAQVVQAKQKELHLASNIRIGLVCEDPKTGEILAAYGGKDYLKRAVDDAFQSGAQVGSSFKPYVLATALKEGIGLKSTFNPKSPQWFTPDGNSVPEGTPEAMHVINDEGNVKGGVNLIQATEKSLNTVYVPLGFKAGIQNVQKLAEDAGLPHDNLVANQNNQTGGFFLGQADMAPLYQASGYSTFANDGVYIAPHTIMNVYQGGKPFREDTWKHDGKQVIGSDVISNVDAALQSVVKPGGTAYPNAATGLEDRFIAGKTGTTNNSAAAWFVGYTPKQMVTAVGMWRYTDGKGSKKGYYGDLSNVPGISGPVMGGTIPSEIWNSFMTAALTGKTVTQFPPLVPVGNATPFYTPRPDVTRTPKPGNTCNPNDMMDQQGKCRHKGGHQHCQPTPLDPNCTGNPGPGHHSTPPCAVPPFCTPPNSGNPNNPNNQNQGGGTNLSLGRQIAARPPDGEG